MRLALGTPAPATLLRLLHDEGPDALVVLGPRRRVGLGDQDVAVGQHVQPARMVEARGVGADLMPLPGTGRAPLLQPRAGVMCTVGIRVLFGGGSRGAGRRR